MLRSMDSAISGMQAFQTDLDVVGNNIANVNTVGYKSARTDFADIFSQTMSGATQSSGASSYKGGINAEQVGLGTKVAAIDNLFTQGASQTTGVATDLDLNGQGMFCVSPNPGASQTTCYTRAGDFTVDASGNLVLPNGMIAVGYLPGGQPTSPSTTTKPNQAMNIPYLVSQVSGSPAFPANPQVSIGQDGSVNAIDSNGTSHVLGYIGIATFSNYGGLQKLGDSVWQQSANSGTPTYQVADGNNISVQSGALEMSNVDLTKEFSEMIVAQNAFAANSKMIGTDNAILQALVNMKNG
jgi:flagellar hook protein FlgE